MKIFTNSIKQAIQERKKNKLDISDLIAGVDIKGQDLSLTIIKSLNRFNEDLSKTNFSGCSFGEEQKSINLVGCDLQYSNFKNAISKGIFNIKRSNLSFSNLSESFFPFVEYQHANLLGCNICDAVWRLGSRAGHGCKIDSKMLKSWGLLISDENLITSKA